MDLDEPGEHAIVLQCHEIYKASPKKRVNQVGLLSTGECQLSFARVVAAVHGLALQAPVVLLLLQAAAVVLLLAVGVLRALVVELQRTRVT